MKRFTSFLLSLLLVFVAMAQSETKNVTVTPSGGSFTRDGSVATSGWASSWTSSTEPIVTISVGGVNNMNAGTTSGFQMARGQNADSNWTFSIADYKVTAYSFKFKSAIENQNVTLSATNANGETVTMTSSFSDEQTFSIDCSNASTATFRISGENYSIIATDLTLTYREPLALTSLEVGQVYRFVNVLYPTYSLNANSATDVNAVTTNETDTKQQWYVEKQDGEYYVLRNLAYGKFLKGNGQSASWCMTDDYNDNYNKLQLYTSNVDYNTLHTNTLANMAYMHSSDSKDIVGWSNNASDEGTHWTITKVDYTTEQITALLEKAPTTAEAAAVSAAAAASLKTLFTDGAGACVTPALGSLSAAQASEAYKALPATLKAMVDKVYSEKTEGVALETAWTEDNANADKEGWSGEYAKKFRVQMYEPYSIAGDITGFLRMNAHANNDNPTGIYVPGGGVVYVMVEGEIKEGATLRLIDAGSNERITNATTGGYELNTGLNVINFAAEAGMLYICYNVDTYDPDGETEADKFPHKLSEYPPLKIHIEGGAINGFYSSCGDYLAGKTYEGVTYNEDLWGGVDDDNDWIYMEERANLSVLPIISHRQILLFQLNEENGQQGLKHFLPESVSVPKTPFSYPQNGEISSWDDYDAYGMDCNTTTGRINIWMETWDRIMHAELATLGLISEDAVNIMNEFYPRWKSDGTKAEIYDMTNAGPDGNTYKVFCNGRDYCEYYNHHGVSLGTTTGYMSAGWNAANYNNSTFAELMGMPTSGGLWGPVHEIGHQFQDVFNIRGATEVTNNVFSNAATWYQGISTSRYNGGNLTTTLDNFNSGLPFVDYNIWSMTQLFYKLWLYYHLAGNNTQFYPRFFEMLRVDPLNAKGATATGTESMLKIYEKMCDAAGEDLTEFFRAHGFFVLLDNYAKDDYGITIFTQTQEEVDAAIARVKAKYTKENFAVILINDGAEATLRHDGKTPRSFFDGTANPEYGGVNDFINGSATTGGTYEAVVNNDGTVTMKGEGGIGFLVFDENGNIISFSDNPTFALSDEAKHAIVSGNATFVSVGSDVNSTPVTATVDLTAIKKDILGELIAKAQKIYDKIDDTYTKVGYFKAAAVASLTPALEAAIEVYNNSTGYEGAYEILYLEYTKIMDNPDSRITIDTSLAYTINNYAYIARNMTVSDSEVFANENASGTAAEWYFVESPTAGKYYLKNGDGKYCPTVTASAVQTVVDNEADAGLYYLYEIEYGLWAIKGTNSNMHASSSQSYNVVGWYDTAEASWWYVTAKTANETIEDLTNLQVLISKTEGLINEVSAGTTITKGAAYELQTTESGNPYYLTSNAPEDSEGSINYLVDGITGIKSNYFHTEWSSEPPSGSHYLTVDLGADNTIERFTMSHTTRFEASSDFPKSADVYGSNDGTYYYYIGSTDRMPQSENTYWECSSAMVSVPYRYLRFNIHANRGYWHMAEFDIYPVTDISATVKDIYSTGDNVITVPTLTTALNKVLEAKALLKSNAPSKDDITTEIEVLNTAYEALLAEYNAILNSKLSSLNTITAATETMIDEVGDITGNPFSGYVALQADSDTKAYYIWCNAQQASDPVANLLDGKANTILHTNWESITAPEDGLDHHITVELGENNSISSFRFYYLSREKGDYGDYPATIDIYGSTDGEAYEKFTTIEPRNSDGDYIKDGASWTSDIIDTPQPYVCLRFMVTATTSNRAKDGHYYWHMAEFKLERFSDLTFAIDNNYSATVSEELYASIHYTTEASSYMYATGTSSIASGAPLVTIELLDAQIADQQAAYDELKKAIDTPADVDKTELKELIAATTALKSRLYETVVTNYTPAKVTLQYEKEDEAGYLYCNAPEKEYASWGDADGVKSCIDLTDSGDPDLTTYLHSDWDGDESEDGLDHYLRVDLGAGVAANYIEFKYNARTTDLAPSTILVQACNSLATDSWTDITTLKGLSATTDEVASGCLGNGTEYRYWRFMVTATNKGSKSAGHPFFALTNFEMYTCTDVELSEQLKYTPTIYVHTTTEFVAEVNDGITRAEEVVGDDAANQGTVDAEVETLQAVYDKLEEALKYAAIPVEITTDEANPVLYNIISKRADDGSKVLQYCEFDSENPNTVSVSNKAANNSYQAWYFMESAYGVVIKPFNGDGKVLGADNTGDGHTKVWAVKEGEKPYYEWNFVILTDGYYNIQVYDGSSYLSNYYNTDYKMGFYASNPASDPGSLFMFVKATFENDNARYYQLSDFENTLEYQTAATPEGTTVGAFVNGDAYSTAYTTASDLITTGNTSAADDCYAAYTALRTASESVARIEPEESKIYRIYITPGYTASDRAGASMRIDDYGKLACGAFNGEDPDSHYYFTFEYDDDGNLYMKNLHSATYLDEALNSTDNKNVQVGADAEDIANAKKIAINTLGKSGEAVVVGIVPDGGHMLHCAGKPGNVIAFNNTAVDKASAWVIEKVREEEIANIGQTIKLNTAAGEEKSYSTLYSAYPVTLLPGIDASIITAKADNGLLTMVTITDESNRVVPAYTAVILSQDKEDDISAVSVSSKVTFTTQETATVVAEGENMLQGTLFTEYIACGVDCADYRVYTLGRKNDKVAMYWAYANYKLENGVYAKLTGEDANSDKGGYVKMGANKAYLRIGTNGDGASEIPMFSFWFGGETTGVGGVDADAVVDGIYDLQGRKIEEVTAPGFYIVNGEKVYISDVE